MNEKGLLVSYLKIPVTKGFFPSLVAVAAIVVFVGNKVLVKAYCSIGMSGGS